MDLLPRLALAGLTALNLLVIGYLFGAWLLTCLFEWRGRNNAQAMVIAQSISVCSVPTRLWAWVLLVLPVVIANGFYFLYLISMSLESTPAGQAAGEAIGLWGTLLPVASLAVMLLYLHRFTWPKQDQGWQAMHAAVGVLGLLLALVIPLVYLVKISPLPPVPQTLAMGLAEALPRLAHGLLVAVVLAGSILAWLAGGKASTGAGDGQDTLASARQSILRITLVALFLQVAAGPFVLMTLHLEYMSGMMGAFLILSVLLSIAAMVMLSADVNAARQQVGRFLPHVTALLLLMFMAMGMTQHLYQDKAMGAGHGVIATSNLLEPDDSPAIRAMPGRQLFITHCNVCHINAHMAPTLEEIHTLHAGDPNAVVQWAMQPGRRRAEYGPMPSMRHIGVTRLKQIADYMLASGEHQAQKKNASTTDASATELTSPQE